MKTLLRFSLLAATLTACGSAPTSDLDIVRGQTVGTDSPAYLNTVRLTMGNSSCTGSIIGPRLILTAAHCVEGVGPARINAIFQRNAPLVDKTIPAERVQMFKPEGAEHFPQFDIAWVELKEDIPAPFKPMEILRDPSQLNATTPVLLAGYGQIADNCIGNKCSGQLLQAKTELNQYYDKPHIMSLLIFYGDPKKGLGGSCYGDSGGPAYVQVNGRWFLAGVTNGTTSIHMPLTDGGCDAGWDIYTFAGDYASWLQKTSGIQLPIADAALNRERATAPLVIQGPEQRTRPTTWAEWVNYANHEDPAWYTVQAMLETLAYNGTSALGIQREQMTEVLYKPELTESKLSSQTYLNLYGYALNDLAPVAFATGLENLTIAATASIQDIQALEQLPKLKYLTLMNAQTAPADLFTQIPQTVKRLNAVNLQVLSNKILQDLNWQALNGVASLTVMNGELDMTRLSSLAVNNLGLTSVVVRGRYEPKLSPFSLNLSRVSDAEGRAGLDWLGSTQDTQMLRMDHMPADSLNRVAAFPALRTLAADNMHVSQDQVDNLVLPLTLRELSVSGNQVRSLPNTPGWKALDSIAAYDNPLDEANCPAKACRFDKYPQPKTLREYCENSANAFSFTHSYRDALWAILVKGEKTTNGGWLFDCTKIDAAATQTASLDFYRSVIDDIRPLQFLTTQLTELNLAYSNVEDLSPLAGLQSLTWLSVYESKAKSKVDLDMFKNHVGLTITGIDRDPAGVSCPIRAGVCYFYYKGQGFYREGPMLGATRPGETWAQSQVALPGQHKTFQAP